MSSPPIVNQVRNDPSTITAAPPISNQAAVGALGRGGAVMVGHCGGGAGGTGPPADDHVGLGGGGGGTLGNGGGGGTGCARGAPGSCVDMAGDGRRGVVQAYGRQFLNDGVRQIRWRK